MTLRRLANPLPILIGAYAAAMALAPTLEAKAVLCAPLVLAPFAFWAVLTERGWIALFFVAALLLPPLPFALGDTGPHPALAIAALGVCAGLVRLREWESRISGVGVAMMALFVVLLGSTALAVLYSGGTIAAGSLARVLLFGIAIYMFFYVAYGPGRWSGLDTRRTTRFLYLVACGSALFACVDFYFQFPTPAGYEQQFLWLDSGMYRRAQGVFYEASTLGNLCAFFIVMICVALFQKGSWRPCSRKVLIGGGVLFSAALIFSYSRASLLNIVAALAAFAYLKRVKIRRAVLIAAGSAASAAILVIAGFPELAYNYWLRLSGTAEILLGSPGDALSGRVVSWRALWDFLVSNPWHAILGIGYKTLPYSDFVGRPVVADNMYLSLLVETGIVGLAVFVVFNIAVLRAARRAASSLDAQTAFFGRWIFCFWIGEMFQMLSGDLLTYWRVLPIYLWVLAIAVRNERSVSRPI
jgi:O-antigen ligase